MMEIGIHPRKFTTDNYKWRVWFRDSLGVHAVNLETFDDAMNFHTALEDLDYILRVNSA